MSPGQAAYEANVRWFAPRGPLPSVPADDPSHVWHANLIRPWTALEASERAMWERTAGMLRTGETARDGAYAGWLEHGALTGAFEIMQHVPTLAHKQAFENASEFWCLLATAARAVEVKPS